jgi:hypothetical protein
MFFKKSISVENFTKEYFYPLLDELTESSINLLSIDLPSNFDIGVNRDIISFELFILFNYFSGKILPGINGFNSNNINKFTKILEQAFENKSKTIKLDTKYLSENQHNMLNPGLNYYVNKYRAYLENDLSWRDKKINDPTHDAIICIIFFSMGKSLDFSLYLNQVNMNTMLAINKLYTGSFRILHDNLTNFAKKYKVI